MSEVQSARFAPSGTSRECSSVIRPSVGRGQRTLPPCDHRREAIEQTSTAVSAPRRRRSPCRELPSKALYAPMGSGSAGLDAHASSPSWFFSVASPIIAQRLKRRVTRDSPTHWSNRRTPRSGCSLESLTAFTVPSHSSNSQCCHWEVTALRYLDEGVPRIKQESQLFFTLSRHVTRAFRTRCRTAMP